MWWGWTRHGRLGVTAAGPGPPPRLFPRAALGPGPAALPAPRGPGRWSLLPRLGVTPAPGHGSGQPCRPLASVQARGWRSRFLLWAWHPHLCKNRFLAERKEALRGDPSGMWPPRTLREKGTWLLQPLWKLLEKATTWNPLRSRVLNCLLSAVLSERLACLPQCVFILSGDSGSRASKQNSHQYVGHVLSGRHRHK